MASTSEGKQLMAVGFTDGTHKIWDVDHTLMIGSLEEPQFTLKDSVELAPVDL